MPGFLINYFYNLVLEGDILVVACTGLPMDPIIYCKLSIQKDDGIEFSCQLDEYRLLSEPLTGLFPQRNTTGL